jgi:hypothetical protein
MYLEEYMPVASTWARQGIHEEVGITQELGIGIHFRSTMTDTRRQKPQSCSRTETKSSRYHHLDRAEAGHIARW